jgi:hypothetical protein
MKGGKDKKDAKEVVEKNIEAAIRLHGKVIWIWRPYICKKKRAIEREKYMAGLNIKAWMSDLQMRFHTNRQKKTCYGTKMGE